MSTKIRDEVLRRIILAKVLYRAGEEACANKNDQMIFTKGLLLLHDAAENALGAVADHLHAIMKGNKYLVDYYDLIEKCDQEKRRPPYYARMSILNTHRNNAKHQGILPDVSSCANFPATVYELISDLCRVYLDIDCEKVSLKSLIRNKEVVSFIDKAESEIEEGVISEALTSLAYAMYHICDKSAIHWIENALRRHKKKFLFPETSTIEHTVRLLEHGVDLYRYHIFKKLTPKLAIQAGSNELYVWHDKTYEHSQNWTLDNAQLCLNFCIDTALKFQREETDRYKLVRYGQVYEEVIEAIKEKATIWDKSQYPAPFLSYSDKPPEKRQVLLTLEKGQTIIGVAYDSEDRLDEWFLLSKDIPSDDSGTAIGFVAKDDVRIIPREKQGAD